MNTENLITKLRNIVADGTSLSLNKVYSPMLPQNGDDICCITLLSGSTTNNLSNEMEYSKITFRTLIRGTENDTTTRSIVDEVFNVLHLLKDESFTGGKIINCIATSTPIFVGKDENQRILYNITFNAIVE